jgi:hypothetical protein
VALYGEIDRDEAAAKADRIHRQQLAGRVFAAMPDVFWLYFKLSRSSDGHMDRDDEERLKRFVVDSLPSQSNQSYQAGEQSAIFLQNPRFHCTALRDFLIHRMVFDIEKSSRSREPLPPKIRYQLPWWAAIGCSSWFFGEWVGNFGTLIWVAYIAYGIWVREVWQKHMRSLQSTARAVASGGFDEPHILNVLQTLPPKFAEMPSVVYALFRLPRRNVEYEVRDIFDALDEEKKTAQWEQWRAFLDSMLKFDDGDAERAKR